jgi:hypothetical protein
MTRQYALGILQVGYPCIANLKEGRAWKKGNVVWWNVGLGKRRR